MQEITFREYCDILDEYVVLDESGIILNENLLDNIKGVRGKIGKILLMVKGELASIMKETNLSIQDIIKAFKNKDVFGILKHFGFSIVNIMKAVQKGAMLVQRGYAKLFKELLKNGYIKKIQNGTMKIDDLLDKYPLLKKLTAPMIVGLLILIWLNISFISNLEYDMDITSMFNALKGSYSITDILASPEGLAALLLVITNIASGGVLSVSWLGNTTANFTMAIIYTALKNSNVNKKVVDKFKMYITNKRKIIPFREYLEIQQTKIQFL